MPTGQKPPKETRVKSRQELQQEWMSQRLEDDIAREAAKKKAVTDGFAKARDYTQQAATDARSEIKAGYGSGRDQIESGSESVRGEIRGGFGGAMSRIQEGQAQAQARYDAPEIATSRAELLSRVMGKGGFSANTLDQMKAGAREEFGTGLRSAEQALGSYYGESGAGGLAGENLALAASELGGQRGRAVRDIDIQNAMLQEEQQTNAISSLYNEAGVRSGIDEKAGASLARYEADQGRMLAESQTKEAFTLAGLNVAESEALASIAAQMGVDLASLSAEEATVLANIMIGQATNAANVAAAKKNSRADTVGSVLGMVGSILG